MKKITMFCLITLSTLTFLYAQDYKTGIGIRAGYFNGFSIKHFISQKSALEGLISSRWRGIEFTCLYEISNRAFHADRLNWYYGVGAHVGFWNGDYAYWGDNGRSYSVVGLDGILGLEYNFVEAPINVSIDWKPAFNIVGYSGFWGDGGALSIRYIF